MGWAALSETANRLALDHLGSVPVVTGRYSGSGFLSQNSDLVFDGQVVLVPYVLTVPSAEFGWLSYGDYVLVDGREFRVNQQAMRIADGVWCQVSLQPIDRGGLPMPPYSGELILDGGTDRETAVLEGGINGQ